MLFLYPPHLYTRSPPPGPWYVGEVMTGIYGLVFVHGVAVAGHFLPGSMTYLTGAIMVTAGASSHTHSFTPPSAPSPPSLTPSHLPSLTTPPLPSPPSLIPLSQLLRSPPLPASGPHTLTPPLPPFLTPRSLPASIPPSWCSSSFLSPATSLTSWPRPPQAEVGVSNCVPFFVLCSSSLPSSYNWD